MDILLLNLYLIIGYGLLLLHFRNNITNKIFILLVTIQLIVFNGLRHVIVGNDTPRYERKFYNVLNSTSFDDLRSLGDEIGYSIIQKVFTFFSDNFNFWLLFVSFFIFISLGIIIYKYSKGIFISYLLFIGLGFYDFSFSGIRQIIAIIIVFISYRFILNKQVISFLITIIIAMSFHASAIIFMPMYFIAQVKWKSYHILLLIFAYITLYIFRLPIGKVLSIIYKDESILGRYEISSGIGGLSFFILFIILIGVYIYSPIKHKEKENIVLSNIMVMSFFIQSLSSFSYLFTRLNMFYLIFIILYIPNILHNIDNMPIQMSKKQLSILSTIFKLTIIIAISIHYIINIENDGAGIHPYLFYWE